MRTEIDARAEDLNAPRETADRRRGLEHDDLSTCLSEPPSGGQPGWAGADYDNIRSHRRQRTLSTSGNPLYSCAGGGIRSAV